MQRNEEQNGRVQLKCFDRTQPIEVTAEIALPDYRSEISRLLWVRPTFLPPSRFIGNGKIDFSGPVCYRILYVGPDGALYGADSEGTYAFSIPREGMEGFDTGEGIETAVELIPDAVISRVPGPRKVSVRCRLRTRVQGYANKNLTPRFQGEGNEADKVYRLCDAAENGRVQVSEGETVHLEDVVAVESGEGELRLISAYGNLFLPEVTATEDAVQCRGEVLVSMLVCREVKGEDAPLPFAVRRRIPFEKVIPFGGILPDWQVMAMGEIGEISATVEGDSITLGVDGILTAQGQCEESVLLYRDTFLPGHRAECRMAEERLWRCGFCGNRHFSVGGERPYAEVSIPADATVIDAVGDAEIKERQSENGRTVLVGELRCHVLYSHLGEYATGDFLIPFRGILDETCSDAGLCCSVISCRVSTSSEGVRADAEIGLAVRALTEAPERLLGEVTFTPAEPVSRAALEICYPATDDSLWTVGKRYGVSPDALAAANGLSPDGYGSVETLRDVRYLLIP